MKARFIGKTNYLGYKYGHEYHILVFIDKRSFFEPRYIWVCTKGCGDVPYSSSKAFFDNWELID